MRSLQLFGFLGLCLLVAPYAHAQRFEVGIGVGPAYVGLPPVCPYGYYGYYPYECAPYGYYGPRWFSSGVFIGAGPWFHGFYGRPGFYGQGYGRGPIVRRRGYSGRGPAFSGYGAFRGGSNRGYAGGGFHGGIGRSYAHGGSGRGGFHGGGRR